MRDVMIDIETLGTTPGSVILSIGAVFFDRWSGEISEQTFYERILLQDSMNSGFIIDSDTLQWWTTQTPEVFRQQISGTQTIGSVLYWLNNYIRTTTETQELNIWSNGPSFDMSLLEAYYRKFDVPFPVPFWSYRDCRTMREIAETLGIEYDVEMDDDMEKHHPLYDAIYQAKYVSKIFQELGKMNEVFLEERNPRW